MLPALTIIPAGAGSGKTYTIQQQLGEWVVEGLVAPERIVAVTFTEAAAAELRERIRAKLLSLGRLDDALKLDQAYISTIHGFGLRLLTEFAFDAGLSPRPRLLNEDEENTLIRLALARTEKADVITVNLAKFGYSYDFNSQKSAEELFRDDLLRIVMLLRSAGWSEESDTYSAFASNWITERYGVTGDGDRLTANLHSAVTRLLEAYPESLAREYGNNATAEKAFRQDFRNLKAATDESTLSSDWKLWKGLRELRQSKRGCQLPDSYDELADAVIEAANTLPTHPGPREQAVLHIESLIAAGQEVLVHYAQAKREAGLVDYGDMIAMAAEMLRSRPDVLNTLVQRIDCLVVDEFQDTNPLQFALLWQLKDAGVPTVTVGDLKQAIMGFQGADPRLFDALIHQNHDVSKPLTSNWRSQPSLMHFINAVGPGLFGDEYVPLAPQGAESQQEPIELIDFAVKAPRGQRQHAVRAFSVGERIGALLDDPQQQIWDRRTKRSRRLLGGDIAVLCPTHKMLAEYASVLRAQGLRVRLQEDGWYASRVVQLACQALAYVANPLDRHAALYLSVTELGSLELKAALEQLISVGTIADTVLERLDVLAGNVKDRTIFALVADTFSALGLFDVVSSWPDADQCRANLLRLQAEAGEFMDANREALASGGYHGAGIQSFLAWLNEKVEQKDKNNQPDPRVIDEDAIQLATWHSSKGREWPVVFVCGMDRELKPRLPNLALGYSSFEDLSQLIEKAQIEYSPKFAASKSDDQFLGELGLAAELESRRLIYVAMTRAREKLVLEWPSYLAGKDSLTYWSILASETSVSQQDATIIAGEISFPCRIEVGASELPVDLGTGDGAAPEVLATIGRRAIQRGVVPEGLVPDSIVPSGMEGVQHTKPAGQILESIRYHEGLVLEIDLSGTALGTFLHRCFEVLGVNVELIEKIASFTCAETSDADISVIADSVTSFERWMTERFSLTAVHRELPLLGIDENGSVVSGTADLVVETDSGVWIIDHKSDQIEEPQVAFENYRPQLECYAKLLKSMGHEVAGLGINWIRRGEVVLEHC
ncbi:MAG: UvrD-helicase domain-containing protein [Candidatus Thiodiazotropha endolucinida]|nr:UvrD-helicase domain-containing protein [Candidatus Thiodiazotropha taylori]MCG8092892.1 UvrD-helicase domain-containing protein [Candidatus Thiodiazotropha endolucinida]MCG8058208.1 UvrD-helicase domain-containing protein [Candidatus Thiodiazotropha taylori]MCG8102617.1 UvrD-helicase domain-containing protein [Candidatus Thiodiazotropha taylori]MCG8121131.1 UvrD-helicase domain-containing protein [Candidatus Thiodiazotropha taylori]